MLKKLALFLLLLINQFSYGDSLQSDIDRAVVTIRDFKRMPETSIPYEVLKNAQGLVILNEVKGGFIFSGGIGSGLVVARLNQGWSAPSAIGTGSVGWGFQIGGEVTDLVLVLNTKAAVDAFAHGGSITLGGNLSIAVGPVGRTAEVDLVLPPAAIYTYSISRGIFGGVSLKGAVFVERASDNAAFYGFQVVPSQLLYGQVPPPPSAWALYNELNQF
ncbi:MAG: hypothetical protein JSS30_08515 [Verrucomicrobia bacterium]|nr:hypothetical protein [Verrucomicrobiota bacterium]